jgi:hypothetical protein
MGSAPRKENHATLTLTIPTALCDQLIEKARAMHVTVDQATVVFLKRGIRAQEDYEKHLSQLIDSARRTEDPKQREAALDALGESIFGK